MADDFTQARKGDVLYSWKFGEVTVKEIDPESFSPVTGKTPSGEIRWTQTGLLSTTDQNQDLFWSRPIFNSPIAPARTQKLHVTLTGYWAVYGKNLYGPWKQAANCQAWIDQQTIPTPAAPEYRSIDWLVVVPEQTSSLPDDRK